MADAVVHVLIVFCAAALLLLGGMAVVFVLGKLGGWGDAAECYRAKGTTQGTIWLFESAYFGGNGGTYRGVLVATVNQIGIGLSSILPIGHPHLFLPWSDASWSSERTWLGREWLKLTFRKAANTPIWIKGRLARHVRQLLEDAVHGAEL